MQFIMKSDIQFFTEILIKYAKRVLVKIFDIVYDRHELADIPKKESLLPMCSYIVIILLKL